MGNEIINIKVEGNTILNVQEVIDNIKGLTYDFNIYEYLKSLYPKLLYSEYKNKAELIKVIEQKIDEFMVESFDNDSERTNQDIEYLVGNNARDERVISYMELLLDKMDERLSQGRDGSSEQMLLDNYVSFLSSLEDQTMDEQRLVSRYYAIRKSVIEKNKTLTYRYKNSSGVITIIILVEILILGMFMLLFSKI